MKEAPTLVVGATGQLGGAIARRLLDAGVPVRALARSPARLAALGPAAQIAAVDLLDVRSLTEACRGVRQIVATANNNMRAGRAGPGRIDLTAYRNLLAAARAAEVERLVFVSFKGVAPDAPVDIFRLKWRIEEEIRQSGVPFVMLRPTAFMDVWIDQIFAKSMREKGVATTFGDGRSVNNYIAVDDVALFAQRIVARPEVRNEAVEIGGPANLSQNELLALIEERMGRQFKRRRIPVAALRMLPPIVRPFHELTARLMTLGLYAATRTSAFPEWTVASERFGVQPRTVEAYLANHPSI